MATKSTEENVQKDKEAKFDAVKHGQEAAKKNVAAAEKRQKAEEKLAEETNQ